MPRGRKSTPPDNAVRTEGRQSATPAWHSIPVAAARRFHQICAAKSADVYGKFRITSLQFGAMVQLNRTTGSPGMEQNVMANRMNIDRNTASVVVEQLVKSGLAVREVNGADRRARLLSLTPKGERIYAELLPPFTAANADILTPISPRERQLFMGLLIRIVEGNLGKQQTR